MCYKVIEKERTKKNLESTDEYVIVSELLWRTSLQLAVVVDVDTYSAICVRIFCTNASIAASHAVRIVQKCLRRC